MTITSRLTVFAAVWFACILAVFNIVSVVWFRSNAMEQLKQTTLLELSQVSKLESSLPHMSLINDAWERSALLTDSSIQFMNTSGQVTSSVVSPDFPSPLLRHAKTFWKKQHYAPSPSPGSQLTLSTRTSLAVPQSPLLGSPSSPSGTGAVTWLPTFNGRYHGASVGLIGAQTLFTYPDGLPGVIRVTTSTESLISNVKGFQETLIVSDAVAVLLLAIGTYVVAGRSLQPLKRLMESIRSVEWSESRRVEVEKAPREIESLAETVNQLLDQVDASIHDQERFVAHASHELRTPLAIIAGHTNLLRRWGKTREEVWEPAVRHIVTEVDRLQKLVDHLLLLTTAESSEESHEQQMSLDDVRTLLDRMRDDGVVLRSDLTWKLNINIAGITDACIGEDQLRQVLLILIDNATQHTVAGGTIELSAMQEEAYLRISVRDTGSGIRENDLPHVFDRFYRGDNARSKSPHGSGLGLSICKELVEACRGKVHISSELGEGTVVQVLIPLQAPQPLLSRAF